MDAIVSGVHDKRATTEKRRDRERERESDTFPVDRLQRLYNSMTKTPRAYVVKSNTENLRQMSGSLDAPSVVAQTYFHSFT